LEKKENDMEIGEKNIMEKKVEENVMVIGEECVTKKIQTKMKLTNKKSINM